LLAKLKIRDRNIFFTVDGDSITQGKVGQTCSVFNLTDLYTVKTGKHPKSIYLILLSASCVLMTLSILISSYRVDEDEIVAVLVLLVLAGFFFWMFKHSGSLFFRLEHCSGKTVLGYKLKSGLTGKAVTPEDLKALEEKIMFAARQNSRWFNAHYTR